MFARFVQSGTMSIPQAQHVPQPGIQLAAANGYPRTGQENQSSNSTAIDIPADSPKPKTPSLDLLEHINSMYHL
jgi:hypothetical protein